jgi:hypothetical protein
MNARTGLARWITRLVHLLGLSAVVVIGLFLLPEVASARDAVFEVEVSLSASEYRPDDVVSGEARITSSRRLVGRLRVVVIDEATRLRIHRQVFEVEFHEPSTIEIPFIITPTPAPNGSYHVRATLLTLDADHEIVPLAKDVEHFAVVGPQARAPLPFWLTYCDDPTCGGLTPLVVHVCPAGDPSCTPSRQTTVVPSVDGHRINQIMFPIQAGDGSETVARVVEGAGSIAGPLVISQTSPVIVKSDLDITLSYYNVAPLWGGTTSLDFVSTTLTSPEVVTTVHRHPSFLVGDEVAELHERARDIIALESKIAGIDPGQMHAIFVPSELVTFGEGNFSDGNLNIFMNYGNPPFIEANGGISNVVLPRLAHEYVHELFSDVRELHPGNHSCLNEGLADAFAFAAGVMPEADFGPIGQRGADFNQGCAEIGANGEIHEAGNCPFWQVHRLGLLSRTFAKRVLTPRHVIEFNSCDLTSERTGNALIVLFSEAARVDMTQAINMAEIPNAGSLKAAKQALGL